MPLNLRQELQTFKASKIEIWMTTTQGGKAMRRTLRCLGNGMEKELEVIHNFPTFTSAFLKVTAFQQRNLNVSCCWVAVSDQPVGAL